jgi:UDP-glucose:(heptosyl)LPS alpha-1,3-glucosyltransferase
LRNGTKRKADGCVLERTSMHIAIVRTVFDASHGGAERYAVKLAREWAEQGHQISVVCQRAAKSDARGMDVRTVSRPKVLGPWKHRWFAKRAGEAARETGADAVLCLARAFPGDVLRLGDGLHRAWFGARYPDLGQRKRALLNPRHRELMKLERELFLPGRFRCYIANSEMIRRAVIHMYGVEPGRVRVVPNGVDPRFNTRSDLRERRVFRSRHGLPPDVPLVLFAGMDFRRKGLIEACRGFAALAMRDAETQFVVVGRGDTKEAGSLLASAGLASRAHFVGPTREMERWYHAADIFVLPTMHDPSANAVTEALSCGTPVVTSSENGARQHIKDGVNGYVLRNRMDAEEIAARIAELVENPRPREQVAGAGNLISVAENAARTFQILRKSLESQGEPDPGPTDVQSAGSRTEALRRLKRRMWAEGDTRDYREVFRQLGR